MLSGHNDMAATPLEAPAPTLEARRNATIGLPKCDNPAERRFPLTPEAVGALTRMGFVVNVESGAAAFIHYPDEAYARAGARIGRHCRPIL